MLRVSFRRVKPGKEPQLRAWLEQLSARADEVRATFADETVRHEQAFILETTKGRILVWVTEVADAERGRQAFARSRHAIDEEHKRIMAECVGGGLNVQRLYDVALEEDN